MRFQPSHPCLVAAIALLASHGSAQSTTRMSVDSSGGQANDSSYDQSAISNDGRIVVFESFATNLVPGDTNAAQDIFVHDRHTGITTRVSIDSAGVQANGASQFPALSPDGRYVAFASTATNLVPGNLNLSGDVYLHDLLTGVTIRVSVDSNGTGGNSNSVRPSVSAGGRFVAFDSFASNLVPGDTNGWRDVFVHDTQTGTTTRVSVTSDGLQGNKNCDSPSISADGRYVTFESSATNLVPNSNGALGQVYLHDLQTTATTQVSTNASGTAADGTSELMRISSDGRYVSFSSRATNLVAGDTNGFEDVFVKNLLTGTVTRASLATNGTQGNGDSRGSSISAEGRYVAFYSHASNLVPGDTNGTVDVFVRDLLLGTTTRVSVDSSGGEANSDSYVPAISADGHFASFVSAASNLVPADTNTTWDIFVYDRGTPSAPIPYCFGDLSGGACPCSNTGSPNRGCDNSAGTGGALLTVTGVANLSSDTLQLTSSGELANSLSIVLQGSSTVAPVNFGDGLRCAGGTLKRLYAANASSGVVTAPQGADPSVSARSAALGDPIPVGGIRYYQVYYRDPNLSFCPAPTGNSFNVSGAFAIAWGS